MLKQCKKCGQFFPAFMIIDNKLRNLQNRKYCIECSPFGVHNTRTLENSDKDKIAKQCDICKREYIYDRSLGHTKHICNSCVTDKRRNGLKQKEVEYKGGKCIICGYDKCKMALVFHHIDQKQKSFGLSNSASRSWEEIKKELDKCVLLCSNCHMELHDGLVALPIYT